MHSMDEIRSLTDDEKNALLAQALGVEMDNQPAEDAKYDYLCERLESLENLVMKLIDGMHGAVGANRRKQTYGELEGRYKEKIGGYGDTFKDLYGRDLIDFLIDKLEEASSAEGWDDSGRDGWLDGAVETVLGKLSPYKKAESVEIAVEEPAKEETKEPPAEGAMNEKQRLVSQLRSRAG